MPAAFSIIHPAPRTPSNIFFWLNRPIVCILGSCIHWCAGSTKRFSSTSTTAAYKRTLETRVQVCFILLTNHGRAFENLHPISSIQPLYLSATYKSRPTARAPRPHPSAHRFRASPGAPCQQEDAMRAYTWKGFMANSPWKDGLA